MRLINADNFKGKVIASHCYSGVNRLISINDVPTAYDVDKVLEQLENEKEFWSDADVHNKEIGRQKARSYAHAIEIVMKGGGCENYIEKDNNGWISCKERLPKTFKAKAYLTTNEDGMIGVSYYHHGWSNGYESVFDVIAWQPLPEPYREEQEDDN